MTKYITIQNRHSAKWLTKITNVQAFNLENHFHGTACPVSALAWCIEKLGDNLQINSDRTHGRLRSNSNSWFTFDLTA